MKTEVLFISWHVVKLLALNQIFEYVALYVKRDCTKLGTVMWQASRKLYRARFKGSVLESCMLYFKQVSSNNPTNQVFQNFTCKRCRPLMYKTRLLVKVVCTNKKT